MAGGWGAMALAYRLPFSSQARVVVAAMWALLVLWLVLRTWRGRAATSLALSVAAFAALLVWWQTIEPSNDRVWADDVSRLLHAEVEGEVVTLREVRHFEWRSETDVTPRWETRRIDLARLRTLDVALSYWMGPAIAHTLVSFGYEDDDGRLQHLVFSVEIRKERGEAFSAIAGFVKQFELNLVAADERDVLATRTNARGEDVVLYSVAMPRPAMRSLFLQYVEEAQRLEREPAFYDTIVANCTTIVWAMARRIVPGLPLDARLVASGYLPGYLYDLGVLAPGHTLDELERLGRITERAKADGASPNFSEAIRRGVPQVPPG